ncbi:uncharacterized protein BP5553_07422 [Venustampulla echinocandica]|uniref:Xylanolytic transcriptional activator regulatory domain-containing protein n=1 Tax=Venustampulla echinocandica TaxID=2656787 RepID=A0A370TJE7_9HELO|nr:uncharacterized protein BP5553_07422 [Venustampulla echinocandica]RDL35491.1 hypothetical protein BP5553_07422 [Venustampulla echinocandica]
MADASPEQQTSEAYRESGRTFYLGEAFSLAFVVKTVCSPSGDNTEARVHYPIPKSVDDTARNVSHQKSLIPEELTLLRAKGAYDLPPKDVSEKLILAFFESFHPAYQVFDRGEIAALYEQGRLSFLVLQTIYFIASTVCNNDLLRAARFNNRSQAQTTFYLRAKSLYDFDQERDKVRLTAVLFLFGFWWQGPEDQKDTWHWLGAAISLAQTLGMHRSTVRSGLSPTHRSLWKRIWWSIYVRDRHTAAALGWPARIQDEDCDVEPLELLDFAPRRRIARTYFNCQILLHRPRAISVESPTAIKRTPSQESPLTLQPGSQRICYQLGRSDTANFIWYLPFLLPFLSTQSLSDQRIRPKDPIRSQLAENKSRQCMLALSELFKSWPVGGWILQLFINLLKRLTGRDFGFQTSANSGAPRQGNSKQSLPTAQHGPDQSNGTIPGGVDGSQYDGIRNSQTAEDKQNTASPITHYFDAQTQWPFGDDLLPFDFLMQDAFCAIPLFNDNYSIDTSQTNN